MATQVPYNITLETDSPTMRYQPGRDGPISASWNLTYGHGELSPWDHSVNAVPAHRTGMVGATLEIDWIGTGIYLYGNATRAESYQITIDGTNVTGSSDGTLLASNSSLTHGSHRFVLTVRSDEVWVRHAVLTVGMGNEGSQNENRTVVATVEGMLNPFFRQISGLNTPWSPVYVDSVNNDGKSYPIICWGPNCSLSFTLQRASAFFLYGPQGSQCYGFTANFTPPTDLGSSKIQSFSQQTFWSQKEELLYWETGLNSNRTYQVELVPGGNSSTLFQFKRLEIIGPPEPPSRGISRAIIGGIAAAGVVAFLAFIFVLALMQRRKRRTMKAAEKIPQGDVSGASNQETEQILPSRAQALATSGSLNSHDTTQRPPWTASSSPLTTMASASSTSWALPASTTTPSWYPTTALPSSTPTTVYQPVTPLSKPPTVMSSPSYLPQSIPSPPLTSPATPLSLHTLQDTTVPPSPPAQTTANPSQPTSSRPPSMLSPPVMSPTTPFSDSSYSYGAVGGQREVDAGISLPDTLPPEYDPAWQTGGGT